MRIFSFTSLHCNSSLAARGCFLFAWCSLLVTARSDVVATKDHSTIEDQTQTASVQYGLDVSFPIHKPVSTRYPWLTERELENRSYEDMPVQPLGNRQEAYLQHLMGCRQHYKKSGKSDLCDQYEYFRLMMNRRQPTSLTNYTETGFLKTKAPDEVIQLINQFWNQNHYKGKPEVWQPGNVYINHWKTPTYLVSVDDKALRGSGANLKTQVWAAASALMEAWTQTELQPVSMYGIRVYGEGAVMLPHVDRLPLVASAMICVHTDTDEPWPTEVYDHKTGTAHNITMVPGDMLLFESASVMHGHPFPLVGRSQAMIFIHFEPTGHSLEESFGDVLSRYKDSVKRGAAGPAHGHDLPPYLTRASPEEENWRQQHPEGWTPPYPVLPPEAHAAAKAGEIEKLRQQLQKDAETVLNERDPRNGWQVLHQAAAGGHADAVQLLVETYGAEVNARTHGGYGSTPLHIAEQAFGSEDPYHPVLQYLRSLGALSIGPEL